MATTVNGTRPTQAPAPVPGPLSEQLDIATREVFDIMLQTPLRPVSAGEPPLVADLTVMVGLSGNVSGIVSMHCSAASAFRVASKMLGVETNVFDETVQDALAEVCNMVAGNFKTKRADLADECCISTPSVISGTDYHLHNLSRGEHVEVGYEFDGEPIWVTLDLRRLGV